VAITLVTIVAGSNLRHIYRTGRTAPAAVAAAGGG
jgi:hypothetical protein